MTQIFASKAYLPDGWASDVELSIDDGEFSSVVADTTPSRHAELVEIVIPGMPNAHSHAFQRALVGRTEARAPAGKDNFWSWRTQMYEMANWLGSDDVRDIATELYSEMLAAGYTSVAEFHYLHRETDGEMHDEAMFEALLDAANTAGIRMTYVPVLYERAGFDNAEPLEHQQRFAMTCDEYLDHYAIVQDQADGLVSVGLGVHSLRAVTPTSLQRVAALANEEDCPMHIHIAEQVAEVEQCIEAYGMRPVEWLLENVDVRPNWCLVHATHMTEEETIALAKSEAVACICPTTEANLGDGLFPLAEYIQAGGQIAIGSDSQVSIDPFEELRWLEYGQRLLKQTRNVAAIHNEHTGAALVDAVLSGGAQVCECAELAEGEPADLVVLQAEQGKLAGHGEDTLLDALVFGGYPTPVDGVMTGGEWREDDDE